MTPKRRQGRRSGLPPSWYDVKNYDHLNPRHSPDSLGAWRSALDERYGKWFWLDRIHSSKTGLPANETASIGMRLCAAGFLGDLTEPKPGDTIRADPNRMPPWLVVPWGVLSAPPGLDPSMMFGALGLRWGDHMATRAQPGFAMWFNMDAPDDVLRKGFEHVLKAARRQWPSPIKQRGRGAANPRITEATLDIWWSRKIIPLLDLDWHFEVDEPDARPTETLLGQWLYGDGQPAREVNKARRVLRNAMEQRAALHHTLHHTKADADAIETAADQAWLDDLAEILCGDSDK
jgi:hypothetical protein